MSDQDARTAPPQPPVMDGRSGDRGRTIPDREGTSRSIDDGGSIARTQARGTEGMSDQDARIVGTHHHGWAASANTADAPFERNREERTA